MLKRLYPMIRPGVTFGIVLDALNSYSFCEKTERKSNYLKILTSISIWVVLNIWTERGKNKNLIFIKQVFSFSLSVKTLKINNVIKCFLFSLSR